MFKPFTRTYNLTYLVRQAVALAEKMDSSLKYTTEVSFDITEDTEFLFNVTVSALKPEELP